MVKFLKLAKLALRRTQSPEDYLKMQSYIAEETINEIEARGIIFKDLEVLELGAGYGGYSVVLHQRAKTCLSTDLQEQPVFKEKNMSFKILDVMKPFSLESNSFDFIYCSSLIEHASNPQMLIQESFRVLSFFRFLRFIHWRWWGDISLSPSTFSVSVLPLS